MDYKEIQNQLTIESVIEILQRIKPDLSYVIDPDGAYVQIETICHHTFQEEKSHKLYFYPDSKHFYCFSHCGTINIYQVLMNIFALQNIQFTFLDAKQFIVNNLAPVNFMIVDKINDFDYLQQLETGSLDTFELPLKNSHILDLFTSQRKHLWHDEVSQTILDQYHIGYYPYTNQITIPHYDQNNRLIGIRGRAQDTIQVHEGNKYMPMRINGEFLSHPTSLNLYGLNITRDNICKMRKIVLFEGEKSVLKYSDIFGSDNNISVGICGNKISKYQIYLLLQLELEEVIIAFDKEYPRTGTKEATIYFDYLYNLAKKLDIYFNVSFIYDRNNLLQQKDAPIDQGGDVFRTLFANRIMV